MKHITRDIDLMHNRDLLEHVPHACITFVCEHGPQAQAVVLRWEDSRYLVGIPENVGHRPAADQEVVLLVDDGVYFFDLRAIYIRGQAKPSAAPMGAPYDHTWYEVVPLKTVSWDYGTLREVKDEH
ncbi:MAG: hypothetical protein H0U76_05300 [Ktedonobacteraceae bacterium]|nr:hypothetical protein [Ktedonobacteraceae bacterium]